MDDQESPCYFGNGYVLLVPKLKTDKCLWVGRRISLDYTNEVALTLSYIDKVLYLNVDFQIINSSNQLLLDGVWLYNLLSLDHIYTRKVVFGKACQPTFAIQPISELTWIVTVLHGINFKNNFNSLGQPCYPDL